MRVRTALTRTARFAYAFGIVVAFGCSSASAQASQQGDPGDVQIRAEKGDANAQYSLGLMYGRGEGVPKDFAKAIDWYIKAAEQGHALAQFNLGLIYKHGAGVPKDPAKAVEWYTKAAEQGNVQAQSSLGFMYQNGEGVPKSSVRAVKWFTKAAEQGDTRLCLTDRLYGF